MSQMLGRGLERTREAASEGVGAASLRISSQSVRSGGAGVWVLAGGSEACWDSGVVGSGAEGVSGAGTSVTSGVVAGSGRGVVVGVMVGVFGVVMFDVAKLGVEIGAKGAIMSR